MEAILTLLMKMFRDLGKGEERQQGDGDECAEDKKKSDALGNFTSKKCFSEFHASQSIFVGKSDEVSVVGSDDVVPAASGG